MYPAITSGNFDRLFLESIYELNRALALLAATALTSEHLQPADDWTANAFGQLFNDSALICQDTAGKLNVIRQERGEATSPVSEFAAP